jgi:hypothetical protein
VGQKREPPDRLAGVSPQSVYRAGKGGQGMIKICREAAYLNKGMHRSRRREARMVRSVVLGGPVMPDVRGQMLYALSYILN